ncbi:MAG: chromosomal replication initiator protein DnaA [Rhodospirillales bacterium]|nr:chromosomal replication initiator protein DnaA [Rhodospirillales bacterium]MBT4040125.1 chromosomal replication initiator protein DnaA [Rhodospirillales bacterium]MBT4625457.1 chromosomal replication initiator protein DnaA [Rhodospirillales bacterium]MBT5352095.1 chromosomal replication initiator protein DnaA [Rhodospirillales bacterium]MBT5521864.1 chromosomal replication initiator protein DnaA [Rhodospirillales bacterium]
MSSDQIKREIDAQWLELSEQLRAEIGEAAFQSWIKPISVRDQDGGTVKMTVPTRFMRDWVAAHYVDRLTDLWSQCDAGISAVEINVQTDRHVQATPERADDGNTFGSARRIGDMDKDLQAKRDDISAPLDSRFMFERFVVGKPNEFAYAAARRVAEAEVVPFNPLFLYGGVGLGKTHLMHAIAWHIRQVTPQRNVMYLSAEKFMYQFVRALREQNTVDFKQQFRSVDVLMIDDVQFISGKDSTQEEFFHTFNALVDQGRQIVISADKSPSDLEGMEERLISRLNCGLVADIHATTYELRLGILQSKAEQMGVEVPPKVLEFLAHKITSNVRELEGGLNRVVAHSQLIGRDISLETTQEVLHDLLRANDRRVTIEEIQKRVSQHFNIRVSDMHSARRARSVARPRQVAMYLAKQLTSRSLPEIGRKFGGRDHTTVMHAVKKVDELREHDSSFAEDVELLRRMLEG